MRVPVGAQTRRVVFGALDYGSGQVVYEVQPRKGGDAFAAFLDHVAQTWPEDHLVLVLDNASYHRSPIVRAWWARQTGRVTLFWLPVYAAQLNLIERVWRFLKQKLACHRFWADVEGLDAAMTTLLDQLTARFHRDDGPAIVLHKNF
jgi:transposase